MKRITFVIAILIIAFQLELPAQSIGINNTGALANQSALLDIDVSGFANKKGLLPPRMTLAQRTAMNPLPATAQGLLVYQTDGMQGFYYNTSLTTTPNWVFVNNAGTGLRWDQLSAPAGNLNLAHGANTTSFSFDGFTIGSAFALSSNSLTSGNLLSLSSNSNAAIPAGLSLLSIARSGMNANGNVHAVGIYSTVTNTGSLSENIGGLFSASGATLNYAVKANIYTTSGTGVYGANSSNDASTQFGIQGIKSGNIGADNVGVGISGNATGTAGNNYGGSFYASGATFNTAVLATTDANNGTGVYAWNYSTGTGVQFGVRAKKSGNAIGDGYAVSGEATGTGPKKIGGYFTASGATNNYAGIFDQGSVGIGTTEPAINFKLHIHDNVSADVSMGITNSATGAALSRGVRLRMATSDFSIINQEAFGNIHFYTGGLNRMAITSNGNIGIATASPNTDALLHVNVGASGTKGILVTGAYNISNSIPSLGAGSRLMFYPGKAAFRAGNVTGTQWDNENVGPRSIALGSNTTASGESSTALGIAGVANGYVSLAMGSGTTASESFSTAMGYNTTASGNTSTAIGYATTADGQASTSMGEFTTAYGYASLAMGSNSFANGGVSSAFGKRNVTNGYASSVVGLYNDSILTFAETNPSIITPLFIVGNGDNTTRSNAFVVQKNAKVYIDPSNKNDGTLAGNALFFGQYNVSGEAIGSKRTATGNAFGLDFFTSYTNRMSIANNGNVGIGTDVPISTLHVKGTVNVFNGGLSAHLGNFWQGNSNVDGMEFVSNGAGDAYIGIQRGIGAGLNISRFGGAGQLINFYVGGSSVGNIATGGANLTFNSTSDIRLKENIIPTKTSVHTLMGINVKDYNYKSDSKKEMQTGFLAQELYKVFPQAVTPGGADANTNPWTIDYNKLTPLLVKSIQDQQNEIDALKKENARLTIGQEELKKQLDEILKRFNL
jgi:hypothetical protein